MSHPTTTENQRHPAFILLVLIMVGILSALLIAALWQQPLHDNQLRDLTMDSLAQSGVTNPVTAVLLNFRAYDTFIEFAVFLCVAVAVLPYARDVDASHHTLSPESHVLAIAKIFVPLSVIMAGYMLWIGASAPGGAFQAASLLAGCLVLLALANYNRIDFSTARLRLLLSAGLIAFLLVNALVLIAHQGFISFPPALAGMYILAIEFFATFAISITLFLCFESIHKGHL